MTTAKTPSINFAFRRNMPKGEDFETFVEELAIMFRSSATKIECVFWNSKQSKTASDTTNHGQLCASRNLRLAGSFSELAKRSMRLFPAN
jgi:hypothetical protein